MDDTDTNLAALSAALPSPGRARPGCSVSSITVVYYTGPVLWACIDSQLAQPELLELILVVNGIDAVSRHRLRQLAGSEARIRLVESPRNIGFAAGCNRGAAMATGINWLSLIRIVFWQPGHLVPSSTCSTSSRRPG